MMSTGDFSFKRVEKISAFFGMDFFDFLSAAKNYESDFFIFNQSQGLTLLQNPKAMQALILLSSGFTAEQTTVRLNISPPLYEEIINILQKVDLIGISSKGSVQAKYRVKMSTKKSILVVDNYFFLNFFF